MNFCIDVKNVVTLRKEILH